MYPATKTFKRCLKDVQKMSYCLLDVFQMYLRRLLKFCAVWIYMIYFSTYHLVERFETRTLTYGSKSFNVIKG